mmetsp:Transcript_21593/g.48555  ORF Transcript_21593/g.48555 Transcript_21593/m.48555 type:complete len:90 (-) Transcript_21593:432-701(-)
MENRTTNFAGSQQKEGRYRRKGTKGWRDSGRERTQTQTKTNARSIAGVCSCRPRSGCAHFSFRERPVPPPVNKTKQNKILLVEFLVLRI